MYKNIYIHFIIGLFWFNYNVDMSEATLVQKFINSINSTNIIEQEVYVRSSVADIVLNNEIAIEAKLNDVRKAVSQAYSYKTKYKKSYILLPKSSKNLINKWEETLMKNKIRWMFMDTENNISFGRSWWKSDFDFTK